MSNLPCGCGETQTQTTDDICKGTTVATETCWIDRPRFFPGQLLTDADLTSELNYIIEKNKLHNRYLHGWGVVCGLKVKCDPCCVGYGSYGRVIVEPGYAIDCCGNDIVVSNPHVFDVIKRINDVKKKKKSQNDPCAPTENEPVDPCPDNPNKYYLVLKYKEMEAAPVTALKTDDSCSVQRCVPSRIKECYELDLVEYCTLHPIEDNFFIRARKCFDIFTETLKKVKLDVKQTESVKNFIQEYQKALPSMVRCDILDEIEGVNVIQEKPCVIKDCNLANQPNITYQEINRLLITGECGVTLTPSAVITKDQNSNSFLIQNQGINYQLRDGQNGTCEFLKVTESAPQLISVLLNMLLDCICQAIINPCPSCTKDDLIILATMTVNTNKIIKINNIARKWVMTFPTLFYWLPINDWIGEIVKKLCCNLDFTRQGSLPLWMYTMKALENDLAIPKALFKNLQDIPKSISGAVFDLLDPQNVSLESTIGMSSGEAAVVLRKLEITVLRTEVYEPSICNVNPERIFSSVPYAKPGSSVIQVLDKDTQKIVGYRVIREETPCSDLEVTQLREELEKMKTVIEPFSPRSTDSVINNKANIKADYKDAATKLTVGLLNEIKIESVQGVKPASANKLKKANIKNPQNMLETSAAGISQASGESITSAMKYVSNAEKLTIDVANSVSKELEKAKVTDLKNLKTENIKSITVALKKYNISEATVKSIIKRSIK